jgi:geranylgeranyl diphosphate synthase type I
MFLKIKNRIEKELASYCRSINTLYPLKSLSPLLFKSITEFLSRKGKRVRPLLFTVGYLGFAKKAAPGLYRSAISLELLHDFLLVHDDIIDKSQTRRGKPSMHALMNKYLAGKKKLKFSGEDLAIVVGDVMYAMALHAFLAIKEDKQRKEKALEKLIEAALYTGSGEFIELIYGIKNIAEISQRDIYKIYDFKTAVYTFASPLAMGAILAGASQSQADKLFEYGICLGRAFQIKDDIIGMFTDETEIGKSNLTDLQEAKKTLLIWYAYHKSGNKDKSVIRKILSKRNIGRADLEKIRKIVLNSGALSYAKKEISALLKKAEGISRLLTMRAEYKKALASYSKIILAI